MAGPARPPGHQRGDRSPSSTATSRGLAAYGAGGERWLAAGQTEEGDNLLRLGDRISAEYRPLARRAGFRECDTALPL